MKKSLRGTFLAILFITGIIAINGCKKDSNTDNSIPLHAVITNPILSQLTATTVISGGAVHSLETISVNGVCWSATNKTPSIADSKSTDTVGGRWVSKLTGLTPSTTYYLRAYVTGVSGSTDYGDVVTFTTSATAAVLTGTVTTIAGNSSSSGYTDGSGTGVLFDGPQYIAYNTVAGLLYVSDNFNNMIRTVTTTGTTKTLTNPAIGFANGALADALFYGPRGMSFDTQGNTYVADIGNNMIRKITPGGAVTTLAGNGTAGYSDGITKVEFYNPQSTAVDAAGNVYVADRTNNLIRKITTAGVTSILAGYQGSNSGVLQQVVAGYTDGTAALALFNGVTNIAIDQQGNIYVVDVNNKAIRKVTPTGDVTTYAGGPNFPTLFGSASGIAVDKQGNLFVADNGGRILEITPAKVMYTIAGAANTAGFADGVGAAAKFNNPQGLTLDAQGNLYVADFGNNTIRKITIAVQ